MRVTSPCANHPSKEASQRCRSCSKWLCGVCFYRYGGRIYCGRSCHIRGICRDLATSIWAFARRPLHWAWIIAVVAGASALLLWTVGSKVAELVEVRRGLGDPREARITAADIEGQLSADEDGIRIEIRGRPGVKVLVVIGDRSLGIITIDDDGHGKLSGVTVEQNSGNLSLVPLSGTVIDLGQPPTPTPHAEKPAAKPTTRPTARPASAQRQQTASSIAASGPTPSTAPPVLQLVQDAGSRIAITFDGNASSNRTAELLDLLRQNDLKVTLFVTGQFIETHPSIVRRAVLEGHEVGNHTYSHPHLTTYAQNRRHQMIPGMTREKFQRELQRTEEAFKNATGRPLQPLWRSPFGEENRSLRGWALEMGYLHVRWSSLQGASLDSRDWIADEHSSLYQRSSTIMERLLRFPELEGGIILMHLATEREEAPWQELPAFLEAVKERGLEPTQVTALLEKSKTWRPWLRRAQARHRELHGK